MFLFSGRRPPSPMEEVDDGPARALPSERVLACGPRIYLFPRMLSCEEDVSLLRAAEEVGWEDTNHLPSATVAFNVCNPRTLKIEPGIIFSRFPNMVDCCRKALFAMLLGRIRALLPSDAALRDGRLIPRQWALPKQAALLKEDFEAATAAAKASGATKPIYIIKPDHGCQGAGIELSTDPCKTSPYAREAVVQEYIANPMLLGGLKFDLRLYVLVTSVGGDADGGPLRAFLCREGMARFAVQAFDGAKLGNVHAHLTNYSLNKKASGFRATDEADGGDGSKRTASAVFAALAASGQIADVEALWQRIGELVARSLSVVQPVLASTRRNWPDNPCFQVLGIDVLLDDSGAPWLLEMNDHPSLRIDRPHVVGKHKSRRRAPSPERVATGAEVDAPSTAETAVSEAAEAAARIPMPSERPPASPSSPSRAPPSSTRLYDDCYLEELTDLSAVDEAIKVPMLADVLRILGEVHGLPYAERRGAAAERLAALGAPPAGFAYGTSFVEVQFPPGELALTRLFDRLRVFFDWYMAEAADGTPSFHSSASRKPIDSQVFPGPRWRAASLADFLDACAAIPKAESDRLFQSVCGKGGSMGIFDLADVCAKAARRLYASSSGGGAASKKGSLGSQRAHHELAANIPPVELITRLLDAWQERQSGELMA